VTALDDFECNGPHVPDLDAGLCPIRLRIKKGDLYCLRPVGHEGKHRTLDGWQIDGVGHGVLIDYWQRSAVAEGGA
jgi:hypothetical protein